ncbi:MAG: HAD-IB family hydrolase [Steroidobacteraceae bacterium]
MPAPPVSSAPAPEGAVTTLAVFDLDGTITRSDTLVGYLLGYLGRHPLRLWRLPMCLLPVLKFAAVKRDRGELKSAVIRLTLGGLTRSELERWNQIFIAKLLRGGVFAEALEQISAQRSAGAHLVLLSASPDLYVPAIAAALGFDEVICTQLRWHADGRLHGALCSANRRGAEKVRCLQALLQTHRPTRSCAYGNSPADLGHLQLVGAGTYVNGSPAALVNLPNVRAVRWSGHGSTTSAV